MRNWKVLLGSACALAAISSPTLAQTDVEQIEQATEAAGAGGQEIIVTAQRREQRALDVPLSIQVATGEQLETKGIQRLTDLQLTTPGFMTQTNSGFTQIYMRGIGNSIFLGADPSVATFVDDVPRIYGSMADNLVDVERIEILKGAQGGLYGRNATGGVVNIITRGPSTDRAKGDFLFSYGEKNTLRAAGFVNLPLGDKVAVSLSAERASHDPYVRNLAVPNPYSATNFPSGAPDLGLNPAETAAFFNSGVDVPGLANQDFWFVRGKLLLEPTENLSIVLSADYSKKNDNTGAGQSNVTPAITQQQALQLYFSLFGIDANLPVGFVPAPQGDFTSYAGFPAITPVEEYGFSGTITLSTPSFDFTSITAHRRQETMLLADANNINVPTALLDVRFKKRFTYQEVRAVSTFEGPLGLIFGGTYLENVQEGGQVVALLNPLFQVGNGFVSDRIKNWSIYAQVGYDLTDRLNITASGRYMRETNNALFTLPIVSSASTVQQKFIPAVTVSYEIDGGNIYARWAQGFKTGGINLATAAAYYPRPEDGSIFGPETVNTFEVGYKQSLMNGRLQLTAAAFYNDYKNLQVDTRAKITFPQLTTAIVNAQSARTYGAEASVVWRATDALALGANVGYLNAKYKEFRLTDSIALRDFDQSGMQMPKAPEWQLSFTADLDQPITDRLRLVSSVLVSHVSEVLFQRAPVPDASIGEVPVPDAIGPAYWLVNARIGVKTSDDKFGVALVADNLFNQGYYVFGQSASTGVLVGWGTPRIIRGEVSVKF